jgi:hypothetical protein
MRRWMQVREELEAAAPGGGELHGFMVWYACCLRITVVHCFALSGSILQAREQNAKSAGST